MRKIAIERGGCGFYLSDEATKYLEDRGKTYSYCREHRNDPDLIACIESMGHAASGIVSNIGIIEIPDDCTDWVVIDMDGYEWVADRSRAWGLDAALNREDLPFSDC